MKSVHIVSNIEGSLGEISNDIKSYLGAEFKFTSEFEKDNCVPEKFDILLSHFISSAVVKSSEFYKFKYKVLIQPIDGTKIYKEYIDSINLYDLIITPGKAGKKIMEENGVIKPILIIPNYYKPQILITPKDLSIPKLDKYIKDKFIFYHESTCHPRKGIEEMCEAYVKAFSDTPYANKVILVIKSPFHNKLTYNDLEKIKKNIIKLQKEYKTPAQILKISQFLDESILKKLWYRTNCYLHFAKIEGFGIPLLRMVVLEKPIITLFNNQSGYMDFLTHLKNAEFIIDKKIIAENEFIPIYTKETQWSIPWMKSQAINCIKNMYLNPLIPEVEEQFLKDYSIKTIMGKYKEVFNNIDSYKKKLDWKFLESDVEIIKE